MLSANKIAGFLNQLRVKKNGWINLIFLHVIDSINKARKYAFVTNHMPKNHGSVDRQSYLFIYVFIYLFIYLTGEKKVNPALYCPSANQLKREKTVVGRTMTLSSHELCIIILLEPVKVDIKRTQTKNKTIRKYWVIILFNNVKRSKEIFSVVSCYIQLYKK